MTSLLSVIFGILGGVLIIAAIALLYLAAKKRI
jgi:hypothetical protein